MVWGVIAAMAVAVSAQVVPGDSYPPRHIEFAGFIFQTLAEIFGCGVPVL